MGQRQPRMWHFSRFSSTALPTYFAEFIGENYLYTIAH